MSNKRTVPKTDPSVSPLTWFAELWFARQSGDPDREATARQQLRVQGIDVIIDGTSRCSEATNGKRQRGAS
jgi:hypothetical protein